MKQTLNKRIQTILIERAWNRKDGMIRPEDGLPSLERLSEFAAGDEDSISDDELLQRWDNFVQASIERIVK